MAERYLARRIDYVCTIHFRKQLFYAHIYKQLENFFLFFFLSCLRTFSANVNTEWAYR